MKLNRKGFTLIELLVTIVVIALVVGISTYGIIGAINSSKEKAVTLSLSSVKEGARTYSTERGENYWKEGESNSYFCVTVQELINKGILDKNAKNIENGGSLLNYIAVVKDKTTKVVKKELFLNTNSGDNDYNEAYSLCTGNVKIEEIATSTKIKDKESYTDTIVTKFDDAIFKKDDEVIDIKDKYCYYGTDSTNVVNSSNASIEGDSCIIEDLDQKETYYVKICELSESGSLSCSDTESITTKDIKKPIINISSNTSVKITFIDTNIYNDSAEYYFKSTLDSTSNKSVVSCTLNDDDYVCGNSSTTVIKGDTWYKTTDKEVIITYGDDGDVTITAETRDKADNFERTEKVFSIYKITFNKGNADKIGNGTKNIVNMCMALKDKSCSITSPSIVKTGYDVVGWNTNNASLLSTWNVNVKKDVSKSVVYYPVITYTVKYDVNGGSNGPSNQTGLYGNNLTISDVTPIKNGYKFVYWEDTAGTTYSPSDVYKANKSTTLTAKWVSATTVTITFDSNGSGYTLKSTNSNCTNNSDDVVVCTCSYLDTDGCSITAPSVNGYDDNINRPYYYSSNKSDKSVFSSTNTRQWKSTEEKSGLKDSDNKTMYLVYHKKSAVFKSNYTNGTADITRTCTSSNTSLPCKVITPTLSRSGYEFLGWSTKSGTSNSADACTDGTCEITSSSNTYYAVWKKEEEPVVTKDVTITFDGNSSGYTLKSSDANCTNSSDDVVVCTCSYTDNNGCSITAPTISGDNDNINRPYYYSSNKSDSSVFSNTNTNHWKSNVAKSGLKETDSKTMYLVFNKKTATFKSNYTNGTADITKNCISSNASLACQITAPSLSRSGYEFLGWSTKSGTSNSVNACTDGTCEITSSSNTYYAVWKKIESTNVSKKVTITFNSSGTGLKLTDTNGNTSTTELKVSCEYTGTTGCKITTPSIEGKYYYYSKGANDGSYYNSSKHWWENASTGYLTEDQTWYVVSKKVTVTETFVVNKDRIVEEARKSTFGMKDSSGNKTDSITLSCTYDIGTLASESDKGCYITAPNTYGPNSGTTEGQYILWNPFYYSTNKDDVSGFTSGTHWQRNTSMKVSENKTWYLVYEEKIRTFYATNSSGERVASSIIDKNGNTYSSWYRTSCIAAGTNYACKIDIPTFKLSKEPLVYCYIEWIKSNASVYEGACYRHYINVKYTNVDLYPHRVRYCTVYLHTDETYGYVINDGNGSAVNYGNQCDNVEIDKIDSKLRFKEKITANTYVHNGWRIGENSTKVIYKYIGPSHNGAHLYANWVVEGTDPNPPLTCSSSNECPLEQNGKECSGCKNGTCMY